MIKMEFDHNGICFTIWNVPKMECDQNGMWTKWNVTKEDCDQNWMWSKWNLTKTECGQNGIWPKQNVLKIECSKKEFAQTLFNVALSCVLSYYISILGWLKSLVSRYIEGYSFWGIWGPKFPVGCLSSVAFNIPWYLEV